MYLQSKIQNLLLFLLLLAVIQVNATDITSAPSFSLSPEALRTAADSVKRGKYDDATVLLNDLRFTFDATGAMTEVRHRIYRIETTEGVENWSEVSAAWAPWHQSKPEIRARVITSDSVAHVLDSKTLQDMPLHQDSQDVYSDERRFGGPLPALAVGVIVEEELVLRDTAPFFASGTVDERSFAWTVAVDKTHIVLTYPGSLPVRYKVRLLPALAVSKSNANNVETIIFDQGPLEAYAQAPERVPSDLPLYPALSFTTGESWHKVAAEYARLSDEKLRTADVQSLMAKINTKDGNREQVIRRIVASLHSNVRYTGIEFGESSLIPQYPSEVLKRKYGDCKDKAALLVTMLRSAGIAANLALLQTGPGLDTDPDLPGIGLFDHAIVYIPATPSAPEYWIDATAQYSQVGTLPWADYGRQALVISDHTNSLQQIPDLTATQVVHREVREFTMAEYGPAKIVETNEDSGPGEADARDYYMGDSKEIRKQADQYVKDTYLAETLTSLEHSDLTNLDRPASIKYFATGRRGSTDLNSATMAIRIESLFSRLPKYFRTPETKNSDDANEAEEEPRSADWWIDPFTAEWDYKITAPPGFKLRSLPADTNEKIGPLSFRQTYKSNVEGTIVEAVLRVENTQRRFTVQEGKIFRDAVLKACSRDAIFITFDHEGHSLLARGKTKEGLDAYQKLVTQHPRESLHQAQLAMALLSVGLGERARAVAQNGTALESNSFVAFNTLGLVLKHDLLGRLLKKGMDYSGAVAAYKKAISLDPKEKEPRANLALLLEYDAAGTRYAPGAALRESITLLHDLKKMDEDYERVYEDNILYDLWYLHDYKGLLEYASALPTSEVRKGLIVASIAVEQKSEAALKKSFEITTDEQSRNKVLANAAAVLVRSRKYPEATAIYAESEKGQSNDNPNRNVAIFSKTKPYNEINLDPLDPRSVVFRFFGALLSGDLTLAQLKTMVYVDPDNPGEPLDEKHFETMMSKFKLQITNTTLTRLTLADIVVSNMHCTVEGDDSSGYKVTIESPGAAARNLFVIKDMDAYKVAGFSSESSGSNAETIAPLALHELKKGNLAAARVWLDRARDEIHMSSDDDPLSGAVFPHFWTKGQPGDSTAMRTAAIVLLPSKLAGPYLPDLKMARDAARTEAERDRVNLVIAYLYSASRQWSELLTVAEALTKAHPTSLRAFNLAITAYRQLKRFDDWENLVQSRVQQYPDEIAYVRSAAQLAASRGQLQSSRAITKSIIDKGRSNEEDLNLYAWYALALPETISQETIDMAHRASELGKNSNFNTLHTLACVYAEGGKPNQAREYLFKAMDATYVEEPNSEIWLGFAMIAEQYGVLDAAETMYRRVEKPKDDSPGSSYSIAQQRLAKLSMATPGAHKPISPISSLQ